MVQLLYLQPVADVPRQVYTEAVLGTYELNQIDRLKDLFCGPANAQRRVTTRTPEEPCPSEESGMQAIWNGGVQA